MAEVRLRAERREARGKGAARRSRAAGKVPGIVYGHGMEPIPVEVNRRELVTAFHTDAGTNVLLDLEIDGTTTLTLARELQRDPVLGTLLHADFVMVDRTETVEVEVPIHLVGEAPGAKAGGVLEQPMFTVAVRSLPADVPDSIDADVSQLDEGDTLRLSDLSAAPGVEIVGDPDAAVASVVASVSEAELEAMEASVAADVPALTEEEQVEEQAGDEAAAPPTEDDAAGS